MSVPESSIHPKLERLAESHEGLRSSNRLAVRGIPWGLLICIWLTLYLSEGPEGMSGMGCQTPILIVCGIAEVALRLVQWSTARLAARQFNQAFPGGTARDAAISLLQERGQEKREVGRAARRCLRALHLPSKSKPKVKEAKAPDLPPGVPALDLSRPSRKKRRKAQQAPIPIQVSAGTEAQPTPRDSAPKPIPLQPDAAQEGKDE